MVLPALAAFLLLLGLGPAQAQEPRKRPDLTGIEDAFVVEGDMDIILGEGAPVRDGFRVIPLLVQRPAGPMTIRVQGRGFVPLIAAVGPEVTTWIEGDPDTGLAQAWFYPQVADEWLVVVTSTRPNQEGTFSFSVLDTAPNPMAPDRKAAPTRVVPLTLPTPGSYAVGPFYASRLTRSLHSGVVNRGVWAGELALKEGDEVQVTASGLEARGWRAWVELQAPDGTILRGEEVAGRSSATRWTGRIPRDGTWRVIVRTPPMGSWRFELDLQLLGTLDPGARPGTGFCPTLSYAFADARLLHRPSRGGELLEGVDRDPAYRLPGAQDTELSSRHLRASFLGEVDPAPRPEPYDGCLRGWTRSATDWGPAADGAGGRQRQVRWVQPGLDPAPWVQIVQSLAEDGAQRVEIELEAP